MGTIYYARRKDGVLASIGKHYELKHRITDIFLWAGDDVEIITEHDIEEISEEEFDAIIDLPYYRSIS